MKPGPATSTAATRGSARRSAAMRSARSRGFMPRGLGQHHARRWWPGRRGADRAAARPRRGRGRAPAGSSPAAVMRRARRRHALVEQSRRCSWRCFAACARPVWRCEAAARLTQSGVDVKQAAVLAASRSGRSCRRRNRRRGAHRAGSSARVEARPRRPASPRLGEEAREQVAHDRARRRARTPSRAGGGRCAEEECLDGAVGRGHRLREADHRLRRRRARVGVGGRERGEPPRALGNHVLDQAGDDAAHELVDAPGRLDARIARRRPRRRSRRGPARLRRSSSANSPARRPSSISCAS